LTQRRNTDRERKITSITIYSNIGKPTVTLNGKKLTAIRQGYTKVHYIIDPVTLDDGKNIIKAIAYKNEKAYQDEVIWNYSGEKDRSTGDVIENKNEHAGF